MSQLTVSALAPTAPAPPAEDATAPAGLGGDGSGRGRSRLRSAAPWIILASVILVAVYLAGPPSGDGPYLDPRSTGPSGTKALVDSLSELGADVRLEPGPPDDGDDTALILRDNFEEEESQAIRQWVLGGGTLIVMDPESPLNAAAPSGPAGVDLSNVGVPEADPDLDRRCEVAALQQVEEVEAPGAVLFEIPAGGVGCFPGGTGDSGDASDTGDSAWVVIIAAGRGTVVTVGGADAFTNERLNEADNDVLAAALLAPTADDRVAVLIGGGRKGLADLVSPRLKLALLQLGIAMGVVALWRGRRLGRPVPERQPVAVAGSELVVAVGNLLQRSKGRQQAADLLRADLRRTLSERLGLPANLPARDLAEAVAARGGPAAEAVERVLTGGAPVDEEALVELAQSIEAVRQEVIHG